MTRDPNTRRSGPNTMAGSPVADSPDGRERVEPMRRRPHGRQAGRVFWRLRLSPLIATSAQLCSVYPFVTDPGLGAYGPVVGTDVYTRAVFCASLREWYRHGVITAPNLVVTGEIGSGKSSLLKCLAFRASAVGTRVFAVDYKGGGETTDTGDTAGEYGRLAQLTGVTPVRVAPGLGRILNPLAGMRRPAGYATDQWELLQRSRRLLLLEGLLEILLGGPLSEPERSLIEYALDATVHAGATPGRQTEPTLGSVLHATGDPDAWRHRLAEVGYPAEDFQVDTRRVRLALQRAVSGFLAGVFDGPGTPVELDWAQAGTILDLSQIRGSDTMTAMVAACTQSWLETALADDHDGGGRLCIYDELGLIARYLPLIRRLREHLKLARALGIENLLGFHRFTDMTAIGPAGSEQVAIALGLIEDTGVRVFYRQPTGSVEQARRFLGGTDVEAGLLPQLPTGVGLWKIGTRGFVVKHQLSRTERWMVDTSGRMTRPHRAADTGKPAPRVETGER